VSSPATLHEKFFFFHWIKTLQYGVAKKMNWGRMKYACCLAVSVELGINLILHYNQER